MSKRLKRYSFSLIEVVIGLTLFSLVSAVLFGLVRHNVHFIEKLQTAKLQSEKLRLVQVRLQKVLSNVVLGKKKLFYTSTPSTNKQKGTSLTFFYKHEVDRDQMLAADIPAKLFLEKDGDLILVSWPNPEKFSSQTSIPMRKEIILEDVHSCSMEFWAAPTEKANKPANLAFGTWITDWEQKYEYLPTLIRLTLTLNSDAKEELVFCFLLPKNIQSIYYGL